MTINASATNYHNCAPAQGLEIMPKLNVTPLISGFLLTLTGLVVALWISWLGLAQMDFGYQYAYKILDINGHIERYAPQNRYKKGFALTHQSEHERLFAEIAEAVQNRGENLAKIEYELPSKNSITLLTEAEVIHLQDVANLITFFNQVAAVCLILFLGVLVLFFYLKLPPPGWFQPLITLALVAAIACAAILIFGAEKSFYWLHTKIFPDDHQWFFYYQESLMTTLMKAPDLFGFIAAIWSIVAVLIYIALQVAVRTALKKRT